ncbi:hypothetical protein PG994_001548 [Apiospora phragmitis]|uniref:[Histone H3]-trimethyl-L-lysine(9) demethylase n=1 Tax=Apiospora phragmitis TaxID=2905665 RepID=A0ABR1WTS4_9PEZI
MSVEAMAQSAPEQPQIEVASASTNTAEKHSPKPHLGLHSPPDSNNAMKLDGSDDSELSDLDEPEIQRPPTAPTSTTGEEEVKKEEPHAPAQEEEDDIGEVNPAEWSGTVPVFRPTMHQFKDFKKFIWNRQGYPPDEWKNELPELHDMVKQVRVREPIKQDIMGSNGTYRQVNILHQRSYNLPQWRQLCDQSEHQPPARRGERRAQAPPKPRTTTASGSRGRGRNTRGRTRRSIIKEDNADEEDRPMTPMSPKPSEGVLESVEKDPGAEMDEDDEPVPMVGRMGGSRQAKAKTQSTSARRKYAKREASARIDEEAFKDWDYRMDISDYTPERCEELERIYWKTLTYAAPLYGADLPGTLFPEDTTAWNLNKLPNLLDVLGTKVPGVNTAYLYLGMWKATFAWHLEDVDLYSINYLHFGAPKQWYSISQGDARRFEAAMKSIWPTDAKACDQFLRHKAFLISPNHLQQYFNIKVNKCVSYPGEFVVTYPYGYHSGYNLGYNCAEAVNFALDSWLPMGKIAKRCECAQAQDSVWVDVYEIERKLRGEETDYEETEDDEDDEEEDEDEDETDLAASQSHAVKIKQPGRKRKRTLKDKGDRKAKKIRLRVRAKTQVEPPCCLCPNNLLDAELLPTDDGRKAHRMCALYGAETWIETVDGNEVVANVANISKARLELKCLYCRSKRGACVQCSQRKCARSYHATCAAAAGAFVEEGNVPIFSEDGTEYKEQAFEFSCRFHRTKRDRKLDGPALEDCPKTRKAAAALKRGDIAQLQYYRGEIFAGAVVENRHDEQTLLMEIIPNGDRVEVEWKWLLLPDAADYHLPKSSPNAIPMPTSRKAKAEIKATKLATEELPRADEPFVEGCTWAEFHNTTDCTNKAQTKVDLSKENQIWYYLGRTSTEARAQYTDDPKKPAHNYKSNFLETIPKPLAPPASQPRKSYTPTYPLQQGQASANGRSEKPYQYKPKKPVPPLANPNAHIPYTNQSFIPNGRPFPTSTSTFAVYSSYQPPPHTPQPSAGPPYPQQPTPKPYTTPQSAPQATVPPTPQPTVPSPAGHSYTPQSAPAKPAYTPQDTPRSMQLPKSTHQAAHSRNKSLPFGSDPRFRTSSSTYASARYDFNSSSPFSFGFMQPPDLGPSPSPQNGQLFQAQARARSLSTASAKSLNTPMTSSAIRPSSSASSQGIPGPPQVGKLPPITRPAPPSVVQKYAFFQVHHNRDSTKYRTPYAPWGGFTNGYEGSLRAHLMKSPEALFTMQRQPTGNSATPMGTRYEPSNGQGSSITPGLSQSYPAHNASGAAVNYHTAQHPANYQLPSAGAGDDDATTSGQSGLRTPNGSWDPTSIAAQLHPAIRSHYAAMLQRKQQQPPAHAQTQAPMESSPPAYTQSQRIPQATQYSQAEQTYIPHCIPGLPQAQQPSMHGQPTGQAYLQATQPSTLAALPTQQAPSQQPQMHAQDPYSHRSSPSFFSAVPNSASPGPNPSAQIGDGYQTTTSYPPHASTQVQPAAPRQTFIPPPRPWEQIQKASQPDRMSQSTETQPTGMPPVKSPGPPQSLQNLGHQIRTPQPESTTARAHQGPTAEHPAMKSPMSPPPVPQSSRGFPEVPEESQALVEDIIMNARRASGSDFAR